MSGTQKQLLNSTDNSLSTKAIEVLDANEYFNKLGGGREIYKLKSSPSLHTYTHTQKAFIQTESTKVRALAQSQTVQQWSFHSPLRRGRPCTSRPRLSHLFPLPLKNSPASSPGPWASPCCRARVLAGSQPGSSPRPSRSWGRFCRGRLQLRRRGRCPRFPSHQHRPSSAPRCARSGLQHSGGLASRG